MKQLELNNPYELPAGLPVPVDDGGCNHLPGMKMPSIVLRSTKNRSVDVAEVSRGKAVFFFFPAAGRPGVPDPRGWNEIPGARGCTPQACGYRDLNEEFRKLGFQVFGVSAQRHEDLMEIGQRNRLPYELLSDSDLRLTRALRLPTFEVESVAPLVPPICIKRLSVVVRSGRIEKVFYPVFPPDKNAEEVIEWLWGN
jgi:peroxiredoxin